MGTRHTVRVIMGNKEILNQYGQWDGYAETAGIYLYEDIKNFRKNNFETLKNALNNLVQISEDVPFALKECSLGLKHEFSEIEECISQYKMKYENYAEVSLCDIIHHAIEKYGYEKTAEYILKTRDTGYKILDAIKTLYELNPNAKLPVVYEDGRCYWDYEINLDKNTYTINVGEQSVTFGFNELPNKRNMERICHALDNDKDVQKVLDSIDKKTKKENDRL